MNRKLRTVLFYIFIVGIFGWLIYFIVNKGEATWPGTGMFWAQFSVAPIDGFNAFLDLLHDEIESPLGLLLLQIIVILITCRLFAYLFMKIGQPTVIGEILAGIFLGPSILGYFFPETAHFLFKEESLSYINMISTIGLVLFMFAIGMELDISEVRKKLKETILISHTSTIAPFFIGVLIAYFAYDKYAIEDTPFLSFALFIGISMSITAFPVLARIIQERKLTKSHLGTLSLACAANGDMTAWCLLALVVAIAQAGTVMSAFFSILFSAIYIFIMFVPIRKFLHKIGTYYNDEEVMDKWMIALIFLILTCSAYLTQLLGLHALFGAFIAGVIMPENLKFRRIMTDKVEDVSLALFLPLFFVSTGLRTEISLLNSPDLWQMCAFVTIGAIVGKLGGSFVAARIVGENVRDSLYIGALMNTRGLMELVVLTIGYEMHILSPPIFVMLVIMTLITTFMTAPLLAFIKFVFRKKDLETEDVPVLSDGSFRLLLSFGPAGSGQILLDVAHQMFAKSGKKLEITALHMTVGTDVNPLHADNFGETSFGPVMYIAQKLGLNVTTRYEITNDASQEIVSIVNNEKFDFLLVGAGASMKNPAPSYVRKSFRNILRLFLKGFSTASESFLDPGALLKNKTKMFIENSDCPVGVFINRNFVKVTHTLLIISSRADLFLLEYAHGLLKSSPGNLGIAFITFPDSGGVKDSILQFVKQFPQATVTSCNNLSPELFHNYNFMLISYNSWNEAFVNNNPAMQRMPSTLILRK